MFLYGRKMGKNELLERVGSPQQVAGIRHYRLVEGKAAGVQGLEFYTGSGLIFHVLPGRGMDISLASYKGIPLSWISPTGEVGAEFFEPAGTGWLRGFFGGLVTTCGLTYLGAACQDQGEDLGIHGRTSYTPACNVRTYNYWDKETYVLKAEGEMRETKIFGPNIVLRRTISSNAGDRCLFIHDEVENEGFRTSPHMILYHINIGFPVVDAGSRLLIAGDKVTARDAEAEKGILEYDAFPKPQPGYEEQVFYHEVKSDDKGLTTVAIVNPEAAENRLGVYVRYDTGQLPRLTQWKMMGQGEYVAGIEPANCRVEGRKKEREMGTLQFLQPGEKRVYDVEIGVLEGEDEIQSLQAALASL